ncbi:methyltransferase domain-containing protein [Thalassospira xiamenensis]|uniref:methyltransferase domain-containing protein n=1 Tax=Thalassospira xiamenensis TaxID=220697 RepID=UPI0015EFDC6D|nr:methyltransferase domain-containing protein [Thalassospira xiamenensis]
MKPEVDLEKQLKIDDLRPNDLMGEWAVRVAADVDWLKKHRHMFEEVNCPACAENNFDQLYEKNGVPHVSCRTCGTQYANPRPTERVLIDFYKRSSNYEYWAEKIYSASEEVRRQKLFVPRVQYILECVNRSGLKSPTLLEIGAGYGIFCQEASKTGEFSAVMGVEPTPSLAKVCRDKGLNVFESSYEDLDPNLRADIIVCYEVIEHLQAPDKFLDFCFRTLNKNGLLVLTCPCISGFETKVQGRFSGTIDHQHVNLFSKTSLKLLAARIGFDDIEVETPGELDTELVIDCMKRGEANIEVLGTFLAEVLEVADDETISAFQAFLRKVKASSHMRLAARKTT